MLEIVDPTDAVPNYSHEIELKTEENRRKLVESKIPYVPDVADLLATEDTLLRMAKDIVDGMTSSTIVLDISTLPKRYFCFLLKRLLLCTSCENIVVTYTMPGPEGYTSGHLAEDPKTCDHLPGFAAPIHAPDTTLVISLGIESLGIRSLFEVYPERKGVRVILSFPPDRDTTQRQWRMLRQLYVENSPYIKREHLEYVAAWDAEFVYRLLSSWSQDCEGLTLAPFGPKPHSLGLALYALKADTGLYYTQPKSYNPNYSAGSGQTWAYVVKWGGIACYDRVQTKS